MLSLRSLLSLKTKDEKECPITPVTSPVPNKSAKELYHTIPLLHTPNKSTPFAYSSFNISNNHQINWDNESKLSQVSLIINSARSSIADLTLPFELTTINNFNSDSSEIANNCNFDDTSLKILIPFENNYSDSSFRSSVSITNITLKNLILNSMNDLKESDIDKSTNIGTDIELKTFQTNNFRYMYQIGHGAFGVVNKSFHLNSCQIVAIKQCRSINDNAIKSFQKEIYICNEFIDCPYIINMIDYGSMNSSDNKILIALEYMNMGSLNKNISILQCNNHLERIKHISFCILNALDCLHCKLYVHNDIKPANILFNDNGDVKLSDFGCIEQMKNMNTPLDKQCGTEYYQSYEKRFASPIQYTTKSDIYSFGVTICELLKENKNKNGSIPFTISEDIISKYNKNNPELIDFLNKCLEKDYNKRWNASQLLQHPFLNKNINKNINNNKYNIKIEQIEDIDDLEFMVNSLIDYYSHYKYDIKSTINNENNNNISVITPIDSKWSDLERLQNISKFSGCSVQFVKDFICQNVNKIKDKYLKF